MEKEVLIWLGLLVVFLVVEALTVGLTSIWLAGGALAGLLANLAGLNLVWQIGAFFVISFVLLYFTRPFAVKYINSHHEKTNYESLIGKVVRITETVDNRREQGTAVVNGLEWTVRTKNAGEILQPEDLAEVLEVSGVKLIVKKYESGK